MDVSHRAGLLQRIVVQVSLPAGDDGPRVSSRHQLAVHEQARYYPVVVSERVDIGDEEVAENHRCVIIDFGTIESIHKVAIRY